MTGYPWEDIFNPAKYLFWDSVSVGIVICWDFVPVGILVCWDFVLVGILVLGFRTRSIHYTNQIDKLLNHRDNAEIIL
jgi:predicted amidohydrolase